MTSLLNPNDIEIKNKLINNINSFIENNKVYPYNKKGLLSVFNNVFDFHSKLNINKDNFLEYIILLIQKRIFNNLLKDYNRIIKYPFLHIEEINKFNSNLLSITNINYENNGDLLQLFSIVHNEWRGDNTDIIKNIDLIYYNIYDLKKSNEIQMNDIKDLKKSNEIQMDDIKDLKESNEIQMNDIKDLKETNEIQMNDIKDLKKSNEIQMNDIKDLKETIKYYENTILIFLLFKIIIIFYYNGFNIK
jgi:hypothetical protein